MKDLPASSLLRWSTDAVAPAQRFGYYEDALATAVTALRISSDQPALIRAEIEMAIAGPLRIYRMTGNAHRTLRGPREIARSTERTFHLFANLISTWRLTHRTELLLAQRDVVLTDSTLDHVFDYRSNYHSVQMTLSEGWLRQWVPDPGVLVGRRIPAESPWGSALIALVTQLTPSFVIDSQTPACSITDPLGALLAIIAHEFSAPSSRGTRGSLDLHERIQSLIAERCTEPLLTANDIASSLGISVRTLHRHLTVARETFGGLLLAARADTATKMLRSSIAQRLTIAEIGRRAGFQDASHFAKAVRFRTGFLPSQIRSVDVPRSSVAVAPLATEL